MTALASVDNPEKVFTRKKSSDNTPAAWQEDSTHSIVDFLEMIPSQTVIVYL